MSTGSPLFDWADAAMRVQVAVEPQRERVPESELQARFEAFHAANPRVYAALVRLAREARAVGHQRVGIGMLFEVCRWQLSIQTVGDDFKINNSFRSRYARLLMAQEPDLAGIFETRELLS